MVVGKAYVLVVADVVGVDGTEGSSSSHSPLTVAVLAYLARVLTFAVRCVRRRWRLGLLMCRWLKLSTPLLVGYCLRSLTRDWVT